MAKGKDEFVRSKNEILEAFNQSCEQGDFESTSITVGGGIINMSDGTHKYFIGTETRESGKAPVYKVDDDALWEQILRLVYARAVVSKQGMVSIHRICIQMKKECTITSLTVIGKHVTPMFKQRFGIADPWEDKEYNGYKGLRETLQWWGTIGGESNPGRRVKRLYTIMNAEKLMKYIEGEIDVKKYEDGTSNT